MSRIRSDGLVRTLIKAGSLFSPSKGLVRDQCLLLNNGIIEWIGDSACSFTDSEILNFPGSVISPPFCDYHLHFSKDALDCPDETASSLVSHGIMSVMEGGDRDLSGNRMKSALGSRVKVKTSGYAIYKKGGYGSFIGMAAGDAREAFEVISQLKGLSIDYIKVINSGVFMSESGMISDGGFSRAEIREIISYATDSGLPVFCHANGDVAIRDAVEAGASSIVHGFCVSDDTLALMKDRRVSLIPTLNALSGLSLNSVGSEARKNIDIMIDRHLSAVARASSLGVSILPGSDSGASFLPYGTSYLRELYLFEKAGLSIKQILSTSVTGDLQEGLRGDFIILNGLNAEVVFVNGMPVSRNTVF